jgi:predicted aldo/keto reductase-like oxidoreductase
MTNKKDSISRRQFISAGSRIAVGAAFAASMSKDLLAAATSCPASQPASHPAHCGAASDILAPRKLGRTGLVVPAGGYGAMLTKEPQLAAEVFDKGFYFIHTAPGYAGKRSYAAIKEILADNDRRKKVVLALKTSPKDVDRDLEYFGLEAIDIIVPPKQSVEDLSDDRFIDAAVKARKAGKVKAIGWACHSDTIGTLNFAAKEGVFDVALIGYKDDSPEFLAALKAAKAKGLGVFAMKFGARPKDADALSTRLKWLLNEGLADSALLSFEAASHIQPVLDMKLGKLGPLAGALLRMERVRLASLECSWCGKCADPSGLCPNGVAIPQIMRYDYYVSQCGWSERGRGKYSQLPAQARASSCISCEACEQACPRRLPVRRLLKLAHENLA